MAVLGQLSTVYLDRLPEDYLETYREKIHALTADDILAAARRHFDSANAQIVLVGDREQIAEQAALFGEVTEYDRHGIKHRSARCISVGARHVRARTTTGVRCQLASRFLS